MKTERLHFRKPRASDADFIKQLVNDPDWLQYIGDRKVNSRDDAIRFISKNLNAKQQNELLGLRVCCLNKTKQSISGVNQDTPIGLCGLLQRDYLDSIDIGYAFCKEHRGLGYAMEAASYFKSLAFDALKKEKLYATVLNENVKSIILLGKLGFKLVGGLRENNIVSETTSLYVCYSDNSGCNTSS
ncbi:MAG: ribosomal-protein-alanine N-acetyltransferase [Glaciecola sp.]|jgi:ribosomal-protein-alanine N-acetyltransferase